MKPAPYRSTLIQVLEDENHRRWDGMVEEIGEAHPRAEPRMVLMEESEPQGKLQVSVAVRTVAGVTRKVKG